MVLLDQLEKLYLAGFVFLQLFVTIFPLLTPRASEARVELVTGTCIPADNFTCPEVEPLPASPSSSGVGAMEFLPLMLTSVYCAIGLTWAFLRLSFLYLRSPGKT